MIQTVTLKTKNLSKECKELYSIKGGTVQAQLFIDTELYGMALQGYSIMHNYKHFAELKKEAIAAKARADKALKIERERQKRNASKEAIEAKVSIIKGFGLDERMERDFMEVFVNANV